MIELIKATLELVESVERDMSQQGGLLSDDTYTKARNVKILCAKHVGKTVA